jgi:hypothetical protein
MASTTTYADSLKRNAVAAEELKKKDKKCLYDAIAKHLIADAGIRQTRDETYGTVTDLIYFECGEEVAPEILHVENETDRRFFEDKYVDGLIRAIPITDEMELRIRDMAARVKRVNEIRSSISKDFEDLMRELKGEVGKIVSVNNNKDNKKAARIKKKEDIKNSMYMDCETCGTKTTQTCGGCREVYYCSRKCQQEQWLTHREECGTKKK